jgi:8-oxo-dGTP pyrophosphatase MutT (NUDIX family)
MEDRVAFHYLARGLLIREDRVLVVRQLGAANTFLPGGHIERGERAEAALAREIEEELGMRPTIKRFLGAAEHAWPEDTRANHEINLLFEVEIDGLNPPQPPASLEPHLEFLWVEPSRLEDVNLQPSALIRLLETGVEGFHAFWDSSLDAA